MSKRKKQQPSRPQRSSTGSLAAQQMSQILGLRFILELMESGWTEEQMAGEIEQPHASTLTGLTTKQLRDTLRLLISEHATLAPEAWKGRVQDVYTISGMVMNRWNLGA